MFDIKSVMASKGGVQDSKDLRRILALPRRAPPSPEALQVIADDLKKRLGKPNPSCTCRKRWNARCADSLRPVQAWALSEAEAMEGLFGPIGVGHGKALALDTRIPTPTGWTTMGEIQVGDWVLGSDGWPCQVTFVTEVQHDRECFDVRFSDGSVITADGDHRWLTRSYLERRSLDRGTAGTGNRSSRPRTPQVRTTLEIKETLHHRHNRNHAVDAAAALMLPIANLPLDPYVLGLWLGDGSSHDGEVTSADPEVLEAFDRVAERAASRPAGQATTQRYYGLRALLRDIGVLNNKHVPSAYLRGSAAQRLALLQGLMDSDGYASNDSTVEFCNMSPVLASAVFELAASLGQIPKRYTGRATLYGKDCGEKHRVCWQATIPVFRLGRKLKRLRFGRYKQSQIRSRRYIEAVTPVASVPVRCITVDSADHSYLCGEAMITTHNTLLDLLTPLVMRSKRAVLLLPSSLKRQILDKDWHYYGEHWRLPNLSTGKWFDPSLPTLYVVGYEELSGSKQTDLLERLKPDLVIADEAHSVSRRTAARTKRFLRHFTQNPGTRLCCWSGTLTKRSLTDYAHLADLALHDSSPVPRWWPTVEEWNSHLDPINFSLDAGHLQAFARPGETAKEGLRRWTVETKGVVSSADDVSCEASLVITPIKLDVPPAVAKAIQGVAASWDRPDGEALVDPLSVMRCLRELSCGFFYRWRWPRGESPEVIARWLEVRKLWHSELRERLKRGGTHMDSPLLLTKAAIRWLNGYVHIERDQNGNETRREIPPHTKHGPLPTWDSEHWSTWEQVRTTAQPETEAVWIDDFMVDRCARWLHQGPGICWYEFGALESRLRATAGIPVLGAGDEAARAVLCLSGRESVALGIRSHGTGKNLQGFHRNLVATPPADGATWEQLLGRTHRQGQEADEVTVDVFTHGAFQQALDKAKTLAYYIEGAFGAPQRLTKATWREIT